MTKDEIKEKLDELGIEYDSDAKKAELEALLPEEEEAEDAEEEEAPKKSSKSVDVLNPHTNPHRLVRSYSEEVHGKDYEKLAHEFSQKNSYIVE